MKRLLAALASLLILASPVPVVVGAQSANDQVDCTGASQSAFCEGVQGEPTPLVGPDGVFTKVAQVLVIITGVISVFIMIIAGMNFIMSGGESAKINTARNTIIYAAVGILVAGLSQGIVSFILNKL